MLDEVITDYLKQVKEEWLRKGIKPKTSEDKIEKLQQEANHYFSRIWLEKIIVTLSKSRDIDRLKYTTHSPKFSHPDVKLDAINFKPENKAGGVIATGSVVCVNLDMYSNSGAAYLKKDYIYVYEFLIIKLKDGRTILEHLFEPTQEIKAIFSLLNISESFDEVSRALINLVSSNPPTATSGKVKQVYFPVGENYHLLSLLTPSPLMSELKSRINNLNFSDENKEARKALKEGKQIHSALNEIYNLTQIGFGGANRQNISVLNNKDGGYFYLLSSMPPILKKRKIQPPKKDFFESCLWAGLFQTDFEAFHQVLSWRKNNRDIRDMRDDIVLNAMAKVRRLLEQIREIPTGWSDSETYSNLEYWQKVWLDEQYVEIRHDDKKNESYLNYAHSYFAHWFIGNYKQFIKDNKLLGDDDIAHIKKVLNDEQELLK
jgi:CRISPR-associated protein Csy1